MVGRDVVELELEDLGGRRAVDVHVVGERRDQALVAGQVRHDAQLDLGVVGSHQQVPLGRHEGLADAPAFRRAYGDVLQVRVRRGQPAGGGDGLVVRGMHPPGRFRDLQRQLVRVGAFQLADAAVVDDDAGQVVLDRELDENVLRRRRLALGGLAYDGQFELVEEDFLQLLRRAQVERATRELVCPGLQLRHGRGQFPALLREHLAIDQDAGLFHVEEHRHERLLDRGVDPAQGLDLGELCPQRLVQLQRDVRILGGIRRGRVQVDLVEGQLLRTLAGDVLVMNRVTAEVELCRRVHVVARRDAVQHVGLEHRVEGHALEPDPVTRQHVRVVLEMVPDLAVVPALEERPQLVEHLVARQLVGRARVVVRERHVGRAARLDRHRYADEFGGHVVETGRLGVEGHEVGGHDRLEPGVKGLPVEHRLVVAFRLLGRGGGRAPVIVELLEQRAQFEAPVKFAQAIDVRVRRLEVGEPDGQFHVLADRRQFARQLERADIVTQALADLALDLVRLYDEFVGAAVFVQPFRRGLGAHLRDAGDVVGAVADQGEVVDDLFRVDVEPGLDRIAVEDAVGHRVDQRDLVVDELGQVLVARRHEHIQLVGRRRGAQRADHVVRLDALDLQQGQTHGPDRVEDGRDLRAQLVGHRRAGGLVLRVDVVAEGLAGRVEHDADSRARVLADELVDHRQDAVQGAGGLTLRVAQARQRMERPVQVGRSIDKYEINAGHENLPA